MEYGSAIENGHIYPLPWTLLLISPQTASRSVTTYVREWWRRWRRREEQGNVSQGGRGEGGEADIEVAAPCHCGRGLLGSLFGFIIGYIFILLLSNLNLVGILFVSFFTSFGYLGSAVENPLDINFKLFSMIFLFSFSLYECLFLVFQEFPGLFLSSLIVGNLLPYFEIFLRFNGLIVLPNQSSCCENEIELSV
jgi:hypothetical protein